MVFKGAHDSLWPIHRVMTLATNKTNDNKVIPEPIDDRKFQEWKESWKSGTLLGITLKPKKCIGENVRRIPIKVNKKW